MRAPWSAPSESLEAVLDASAHILVDWTLLGGEVSLRNQEKAHKSTTNFYTLSFRPSLSRIWARARASVRFTGGDPALEASGGQVRRASGPCKLEGLQWGTGEGTAPLRLAVTGSDGCSPAASATECGKRPPRYPPLDRTSALAANFDVLNGAIWSPQKTPEQELELRR